jgi:hypothetical protein
MIGKLPIGRRSIFLCCLLPTCTGCDQNDVEILSRIGHKVNNRFQVLVGEPINALNNGWLMLHANGGDLSLDMKVTSRLRWDMMLADRKIQVSANDGVVELRGEVADQRQRQHALDLAETTAGVVQVIDSLKVAQ